MAFSFGEVGEVCDTGVAGGTHEISPQNCGLLLVGHINSHHTLPRKRLDYDVRRAEGKGQVWG